jgi:hypothetical protein
MKHLRFFVVAAKLIWGCVLFVLDKTFGIKKKWSLRIVRPYSITLFSGRVRIYFRHDIGDGLVIDDMVSAEISPGHEVYFDPNSTRVYLYSDPKTGYQVISINKTLNIKKTWENLPIHRRSFIFIWRMFQ